MKTILAELLILAAVIALPINLVNYSHRITALERESKQLKAQITDMGAELDNVETQLHIDRESVQN